MSQVISGKTQHRGFWLLVLLMVLLTSISSIFAIYTTRHAAENMEENLTITLTANAKGKADAINLWLSTILTDTSRFADRDMIRLFCAESVSGGKSTDTSSMNGSDDATYSGENLGNVRTIIQQQLATFIEETEFVAGGIWDADLENLLHTKNFTGTLSDDQSKLLQNTLQSGKAVFSSVHDGLAGLMLTLVYPIFPPEYTDLPKDDAVATLVLEIPLEVPLKKILDNKEQGEEFPYRLFQWNVSDRYLEYVDLNTGTLIPLEGWDTPKGKTLPLGERLLPNGEYVYSRGILVPDQDLLVTSEEPAHIAESFYNNFRNFMIIFVVGGVIIAGFLLWAVWWFFVGKHERNVEASMRKLHEDVSSQQQIIDSINATLTDGVILTDTLGNIRYSNASFAKMVHHEDDSDIVGTKMGGLLHPDVAEQIQQHLERVVRSENALDFEYKFTIKGKQVFWQAVYTPYFGEQDHVNGVVVVYRDTTKMVAEREAEQQRIDQLIQVFTMSIGLVNPYLKGHSVVMGELAVHLARQLNRSVDEQKTIHIASALSQMGMISLPKEIINKKGALTPEERAIMETHVTKTCDMLGDFDFGLPVQQTIMQMHEKLNGTGYPNKLKGDEIIAPARILNIANTFCAILRPRVYRKAKTLEDTIAIIARDTDAYDIRVITALKSFMHTQEGKEFLSKLQNKNAKF